ncbi:hypothetical protein QQ73_14675, partial [Candidatus Endoriftia persephone str. Guaymas]|nr:hypothetical protein [Candidatus Endoriftia persephone str. Guaymas]
NPYLYDLLGYSEDELKGMTWAEMTHPDDLAADKAQFNRMLAGEIHDYELDKRLYNKAGNSISQPFLYLLALGDVQQGG